jgi:hypothetical protein
MGNDDAGPGTLDEQSLLPPKVDRVPRWLVVSRRSYRSEGSSEASITKEWTPVAPGERAVDEWAPVFELEPFGWVEPFPGCGDEIAGSVNDFPEGFGAVRNNLHVPVVDFCSLVSPRDYSWNIKRWCIGCFDPFEVSAPFFDRIELFATGAPNVVIAVLCRISV